MAGPPWRPRLVRRQPRGHDGALDERPLDRDSAPGRGAAGRRPLRQPQAVDRLLPRPARGRVDRVHPRLRRAALQAHHRPGVRTDEGSRGAGRLMRVDEHIQLRWENMLSGIRQQPDWLTHGPRELLEHARELIDGPAPPRVYLTGCGDSHYAGLAARHAFEAWSGIATQALPALELARYDVEFAPAGSWAICVSNSGKVVRTVEAAATARARGLRAIGVTYDPQSRLAAAAHATLPYPYEDPGFRPGTISYVASLGALYALAVRAAELAGRPASLAAVEAAGGASRATIELADPVAERLGRDLPAETKVDVVGGGPSLGTAWFGRAKM